MKNSIKIIMIILVFIFSFCSKDDSGIDGEKENGGVNIVSPDGSALLPAEEGPIRSAFGNPEIDLDTFKLEITGLVDSSFAVGWDELLEYTPAYTDTMIMYCVEGWEVWGNWKGILIKELLEKASVHQEGEYILFESVEGYKTILSLSYIEKYDAMLAYEVNNSFLQEHDGFPLRLIAFGKYGYKWSKWVNKMEIMSFTQISNPSFNEFNDPGDVPLERRIPYEGKDVKPLEY